MLPVNTLLLAAEPAEPRDLLPGQARAAPLRHLDQREVLIVDQLPQRCTRALSSLMTAASR
ncbi:hypothetical protein [Terrabacter sp. NPDC000476]|uniref:hypothetical protein n=1 Tax=Terrabacter sp. NPDC000476 TaxID=3154258 RepID=UPI00332B32A4